MRSLLTLPVTIAFEASNASHRAVNALLLWASGRLDETKPGWLERAYPEKRDTEAAAQSFNMGTVQGLITRFSVPGLVPALVSSFQWPLMSMRKRVVAGTDYYCRIMHESQTNEFPQIGLHFRLARGAIATWEAMAFCLRRDLYWTALSL